MKIYGIEKVSLVDFDGHICCTLFTGGCNFRCPYCHNAGLVLGRDLKEISEEDIFSHLSKRRAMIDSVCISGGEPTINPDLPEFIKKIKALGFLVKLDTNGTNPKMLEYLIDNHLVDAVAMDIKSSKEGYFNACGADDQKTQNVAASVEILMKKCKNYEFRTTLVENLVTKKDVNLMASWLADAQKMYLQKFEDKGGNLASGLSAVSRATALEFKKILEKTIPEVHLRGYD